MEIDEASTLIESLKKALRDIDKQFGWDNQNHFSKPEINSEIKRKINLCFDKNWSKELAESSKGKKGNSKLSTYKEFKTRVEIREILDMCQCESSPNSTNEVKNKRTSIENRNRQISITKRS